MPDMEPSTHQEGIMYTFRLSIAEERGSNFMIINRPTFDINIIIINVIITDQLLSEFKRIKNVDDKYLEKFAFQQARISFLTDFRPGYSLSSHINLKLDTEYIKLMKKLKLSNLPSPKGFIEYFGEAKDESHIFSVRKILNLSSEDSLNVAIEPGDATPEEVAELLGEISTLYRMVGGSGLTFTLTAVDCPEVAR